MKKIIAFTLIIFLGAAVYGQNKGDQAVYVNWNFGPTINNHFVSNFSARGASVGYSTFVMDNLAIGGEFGWNNYYKYSAKQTYQFKDGAVTTDMYKYIFTVPVTATVTKYFKTGKKVYPYGKLGLGAQYSEQNLYYNIYQTTHNDWGFVAVPEVGANIKFDRMRQWCFNAGAQYKYATNKATEYNIKNLQSFNFSLGITWQIN
ncbi:MAG: outer membrane beta-barrel protein [Bacteroidota bacterium]